MGVADDVVLNVRETVRDSVRAADTAMQDTIVLARIFDAMPVGVIFTASMDRVAMANTEVERMFCLAREDLIVGAVERLIPERHRDTYVRQRRDYAAQPVPNAMGVGRELYGRRGDGTEFSVEIGLRPFAMAGVVGVIATIVDITRRKDLERDLRQANENLEGFASVASRDLKAPLHGMARLAKALVADLATMDRPDTRANLDRIVAHIARMERMIEDLRVSAARALPRTAAEPAVRLEPVD
ncbi:MAG: PAS domain S-box protein [Alphaproteobacteria bacterium]|nr:PAS domain S-box protein [Alphaproteobacteria bacterium]